MPNILSALFLATSLLWYGSSQHPTDTWNDNCAVKWDPIFDNYTDFNSSTVYNNVSDIKHGKLFKQTMSGRCPLVDYYGKPYYDLNNLLGSSNQSAILSSISNTGGGNIIVKTTTSGNKLIANQSISIPSNINLIIPEGKKLTNVDYNQIIFNGYSNSTILCLGQMYSGGNTTLYSTNRLFANTKFIFSPNSIMQNNITNPRSLISKYLLYPGIKSDCNNIAPSGVMFLNRFVNKKTNYELSLFLTEGIHVVYPKFPEPFDTSSTSSCICYDRYIGQKCLSSYNRGKYGNLHNICARHERYNTSDGSYYNTRSSETEYKLGFGPGQYSFEEVTAPLTFIVDKTGNKAVLGIKPYEDNEFARYDAKLWNECKLNEGIYNLSYYNNFANKGNYINTNEMYKLFYDVINSNQPLKIATDTIYLGLLGTRPVELVTNSGIVRIFGNNIQYKGALRLPNTVTKVYYDSENSTISNLQHLNTNNIVKYINSKTPDLSGITFYYLNKMLSVNIHMHSNTLDMNLASERGKDSVLLLTDSATPTWQKKRVIIKGNNKDFKGVIITPPAVETIECYGKNACPKNIINISGKMLKFIIRDNPNNRLRGRPNKNLGNSTMDVMSSNGTLLGNITTENTTIDIISGIGNTTTTQNGTSLENLNNSIINNIITNNSLDKPGIIKLNLEDEYNTPLNIEKRNIIISTICAVFPKIPLICGKK